jgi:hypothetical protein
MRYLIPLLFAPSLLLADPPTIEAVKASGSGSGWRFDVTLAHPDTGWDHYADGWRIELEDGTVLGTRELLHPHVTEQPFTRSLSSVQVPDGVIRVYVRARCNLDGWSDDTVTHDLR